jgi:hypothetical protein
MPGMYLAGGSGRPGSVYDICFPLLEDGGPISTMAALQLLDPDCPFRMSFGKWLFVHAEWASSRVETIPSDDSDELPLLLEVHTDLSDPPGMDSDPSPRSEAGAFEATAVAPPLRQPSREEKFPPLPDVTSQPVIDSDLHQRQVGTTAG